MYVYTQNLHVYVCLYTKSLGNCDYVGATCHVGATRLYGTAESAYVRVGVPGPSPDHV